MRKFIVYLTALVGVVGCRSYAVGQYYFYNEHYYESALTWQPGFSLGGMNCLTDLGGKKGAGGKFIKDINWSTTQPCVSIFAAINYKEIIGARVELAFGQVKANDNILKNDRSVAYGRLIRNLNFRTNIRELSCIIELYPFSIFTSYDKDLPVVSPYILSGIGTFSFSPETFYNNTWVSVSALHTEGQGFAEYPDRKPYKLTQLNMPLGLGLKYEASPVLSFHFEIIYRKLWTDYLDDVSKRYIDPGLFRHYLTPAEAKLAEKLADRRLTADPAVIRMPGDIRGNDKNNDSYFSGTIEIAFILGRQKR